MGGVSVNGDIFSSSSNIRTETVLSGLCGGTATGYSLTKPNFFLGTEISSTELAAYWAKGWKKW